jgi:Na+-transporting NADH:ubiquinone oxidoreductase subunit B
VYERFFQKQVIMRRLLLALAPIAVFAFILYGWRLLLLAVPVFVAGVGLEYVFESKRGKKVSEAAFVTCSLFTLSLPPQTPWWVAVLGIAFAIVFGKEVYGGFGRNVFNPAIAGRLFVYIAFPSFLQSGYLVPGRFGFTAVDGITTATPLVMARAGESVDILNLVLGFRAGAMGESSIALIVLAAVYLIWTRTANWRIIATELAAAAVCSFGFELLGLPKALPALPSLLSGSVVMVGVFYATDPVSAPKKTGAQYIYGALIGSLSMVIQNFSLFPVGTSFAVIIGNTFASLLDELIGAKKRAKAPAASAATAAPGAPRAAEEAAR